MVANPTPAVRRSGTTNPRNVIVEYTRAIIDRAIERPDRVSVSEIVEQALERFGSDQAFMMNLALMNVREIVNAAVRETIAETRGPSRRVIVRDTIVMPQEQLAETSALMQSLALRWGRFREWNGQVHVLLPKMTRIDLLAAAEIRRERAERELAYAILFERLAARLPNDTVRVEEVVKFDEIEHEYAVAKQTAEGGGIDA
jgi:hypothetical protein